MAKVLTEAELTRLLREVVTTQGAFFAKRCLDGKTYVPKHLFNYLKNQLDFQQLKLIMESESETMYIPILRSLVSANVTTYGETYPDRLKTPKGAVKLTDTDVDTLLRSHVPHFDKSMYLQTKGGFLDVLNNLYSYFQNDKRILDVVSKNSRKLPEIVNEEFMNFCKKMSTQEILPIKNEYKLSTTYHENVMTNIENYSNHIKRQATYLVTNGLEQIKQTDGVDIVRLRLAFPSANGLRQTGLPLIEIYPTAVIYSYNDNVQLVSSTNPVKIKELMQSILEDAKVLKVTNEEARELWHVLSNVCHNGVYNRYR